MKVAVARLPIHAGALLACALAVIPTVSAQTTYRWLDSSGRVHYSDQPPPADARKAMEKWLGGNVIGTSELGYEARKAAEAFPVTLYVPEPCSAACQDGRALLRARGVPYTERAVRSEADAEALARAFGSRDAMLPSLTVGPQKLRGLDADAWNRALDAARYPATVSPAARRTAERASPPAPPPAPEAPENVDTGAPAPQPPDPARP